MIKILLFFFCSFVNEYMRIHDMTCITASGTNRHRAVYYIIL